MTWQRVGLGVILLGLLLFVWPTPALACSGPGPGPLEESVSASEVVVAGHVTDWVALGEPDEYGFIPVRIIIKVERVFKGDAPAQIQVFDNHSLRYFPEWDKTTWDSDSCSPFAGYDPKGLPIVLGGKVESYDSGDFRLAFILGPAPGDEFDYRSYLKVLSILGPGTLPAAGAPRGMAAPLLIMSGALLVVAALVRQRRNVARVEEHACRPPSPRMGRGGG